jgi:putative peptidoglycan lipid II flippase
MPYEVVGLALSLTLSSFLQVGLLIYALRRKVGLLGFRVMLRSMTQQFLFSLLMGFIAWFIASFGDWTRGPTLQNFALLGLAVFAGVISYAALSLLAKTEEAMVVWNMGKRKFKLP